MGALFGLWLQASGDVTVWRVDDNQSFHEEVSLHLPSKKPRALLVLLPSGTENCYAEDGEMSPSTIPRVLAKDFQIATAIIVPKVPTLYGSDETLVRLHRTVKSVLLRLALTEGPLMIGGFSSGGLGAMRYVMVRSEQFGSERPVAAVFAVDSPLDYERWAITSNRYLRRLGTVGKDLREERVALSLMKAELGEGGDGKWESYRKQSPVIGSRIDGGGVHFFDGIPVRYYIEPALEWRLRHWNRDADASNLRDGTALIGLLQLRGNQEAELITTMNKGQRADGVRNPHSWSIVDEPDLVTWLARCGLSKEE